MSKDDKLLYPIDETPGIRLPTDVRGSFGTVKSIEVCPIERCLRPDFAQRLAGELMELDPAVGVLLKINSGGGDLSAVSAISAVVGPFANRHVGALVVGDCKSGAMDIFLAVPKGRRFALPGTSFMFHSHSPQLTLEGQYDPLGETVGGLTEKALCEKVKLWLGECHAVERHRMELFKPYLEQLTEGKPESFLGLNHSFSAATAERIGVVGKIVQLLDDKRT